MRFSPDKILVESASELPEPRDGVIFADCETRSRHDDLRSGGNQPYLGDRVAMWGVCWEDGPAYAVPIRMRDGRCNLDPEVVSRWLSDCLKKASAWSNAMVKFDAHFAHVEGVTLPRHYECVNTLAKIIDSDRWSHNLKDLAREWLGASTRSEDAKDAFLEGYKLPRNAKAKDYALVPTDILAEYNCDDVLHTRALRKYCLEKLHADLKPTWEMEKQLTAALMAIELRGLRVDPKQLRMEQVKCLHAQIRLATRINELVGMEYAAGSEFPYALIMGHWGLPSLGTTAAGNPSFDKDTLKLYLTHPEVVADAKKSETLKAMMAIKKEETYNNLFLSSFLEQVDSRGFIHASYNQMVRTGRMSAKDPNTQQFDERAKMLIHADEPGMGWADWDASQIEFRFIAHYMEDPRVLKAYREDPNTDFHAWVSATSGMKRTPSKTLNFSVAFGAGMNNTVGQLASDDDVVAAVNAQIEQELLERKFEADFRMKRFAQLTRERGMKTFRAYHDMFPSLKRVSDEAARAARRYGFVFNVFGRRRHLPVKAARNAFNTLCQGGAGDYVKRKLIRLENWDEPKKDGVTLRVTVHDSIVAQGPSDALRRWEPIIRAELEKPILRDDGEPYVSVPILWKGKITEDTWEKKA
jgi:DNA polymerase I-like protein with 3'-5' exonuclease and polymerase domains